MLKKENSMLIIIDVQERLVNALRPDNSTVIADKTEKIARAARILGVETLVTEQYPKGLGNTIEPVCRALGKYSPLEKTNFSIVKEKEIFDLISNSGKKQIILTGIEAHICVFQSALELFEKGYEVFVGADLTFSRKEIEKETAMANLRSMKIQTPSLEMILFMWLEGSKNKDFKEIQALIK